VIQIVGIDRSVGSNRRQQELHFITAPLGPRALAQDRLGSSDAHPLAVLARVGHRIPGIGDADERYL